MGVTDANRAEIAKISASDLVCAKPSRILLLFEAEATETVVPILN